MYVSEVEPAMTFMLSAAADETVQIGVKVAGDDVEKIFYGRVALEEPDREQFHGCMDALLKKPPSSATG